MLYSFQALVDDQGEFHPTGVKVFLGEYSLFGDVEPLPRQIFSVFRIMLHPFYEASPQVKTRPRQKHLFNPLTSADVRPTFRLIIVGRIHRVL